MSFQDVIDRQMDHAAKQESLRVRVADGAEAAGMAALDRGFRDSEKPNRATRRALNSESNQRVASSKRPSPEPAFNCGPDYARTQEERGKRVEGGYALEGLIPRSQSCVWFGDGGIGKTMLALWQALCFAARGPNAPRSWCGQKIRRRGIVIVYSGEDALGDARERLRDLAETLIGLRGDELEDTLSRVVFINPTDLEEVEFEGYDAALFENEQGKWYHSANAEGIIASITAFNDAATRADERVIGVFQDSATSVCGFDAMEGEAVSRYFGWVNRTCRKLEVFWVILGHVSQDALKGVDPYNPEHRARHRLRGVVIWITAPRLVVEVRVPFGPKNASDKGWHECLEAFERNVIQSPAQALVVTVVKANAKEACEKKIWIRWSKKHLLQDMTHLMAGASRSKAQFEEAKNRSKIEAAAAAGLAKPLIDRADASDVVLALCEHLTAQGKQITLTALASLRKNPQMLSQYSILHTDEARGGRSPRNGGIDANDNREGSFKWHLDSLVRSGDLAKKGAGWTLASAVEPEIAEPVVEPDRSEALGAVLAIVRDMSENERKVRVDERSVQSRALSTRWRTDLPVLAVDVDKGGLARNRMEKGQPVRNTYHWALDELVSSGILLREVDGRYSLTSDQSEAVVEIEPGSAVVAIDREPYKVAIIEIVADMHKSLEEGDVIAGSDVERAALSSAWRKVHPVLRTPAADGGIVRNTNVSGEPKPGSCDWYLDQLVAEDRIVRRVDGSYRPVVEEEQESAA